jgi:hypothetical protein
MFAKVVSLVALLAPLTEQVQVSNIGNQLGQRFFDMYQHWNQHQLQLEGQNFFARGELIYYGTGFRMNGTDTLSVDNPQPLRNLELNGQVVMTQQG